VDRGPVLRGWREEVNFLVKRPAGLE
jgi:hypothetical protein